MSLDAPICQSLRFPSHSAGKDLPHAGPSPSRILLSRGTSWQSFLRSNLHHSDPSAPAPARPRRSPWPTAVCVWGCWSCRLWLSTEMPLSLWSFSPSGGGVWFAGRLLAPCLFCLQLFHLQSEDRPSLGGGLHWPRGQHLCPDGCAGAGKVPNSSPPQYLRFCLLCAAALAYPESIVRARAFRAWCTLQALSNCSWNEWRLNK